MLFVRTAPETQVVSGAGSSGLALGRNVKRPQVGDILQIALGIDCGELRLGSTHVAGLDQRDAAIQARLVGGRATGLGGGGERSGGLRILAGTEERVTRLQRGCRAGSLLGGSGERRRSTRTGAATSISCSLIAA